MKKLILATLAMLFVGMISSVPAAAETGQTRPFKGSIEAHFFVEGTCNEGTGFLQRIVGSGHASHIGRFDIDGSNCLTEDPQPGVVTWTAGNGDTITITFAPIVGEVDPDGLAPVTLVTLGTTGTGRFEHVQFGGGANPSGTVQYFDSDGLTGFIQAEVSGTTITYDASDRADRR